MSTIAGLPPGSRRPEDGMKTMLAAALAAALTLTSAEAAGRAGRLASWWGAVPEADGASAAATFAAAGADPSPDRALASWTGDLRSELPPAAGALEAVEAAPPPLASWSGVIASEPGQR
jgi:hypothetical protein